MIIKTRTVLLVLGLAAGMAAAPVLAQSPTPAPTQAQPAQPAPVTPPPAAATTQAQATPPAAPAAVPAAQPDIALTLPHDLSPWGMFLSADLVVKAVMLGLAFASLLTWTIWLAKAIELMLARRQLSRANVRLAQARSLHEGLAQLARSDDARVLARAAEAELALSADAMNAEGVKERIASRLSRLEAAAGRRMMRGTGLIATIAATAPFVGLFGTVWGIMNSFIGISKQHTTNLAVVAPGIAEALLATALGLVAAIPAVIMYNLFSRWLAGYRAQQADCAAEILRLISRDLDREAALAHHAEHRRVATAAE